MTVSEEGNQQQTPFGTPTPARSMAREAVDEMVEAGLFDDLTGRIDEGGLRLTGEDGFLPEMIKRVLERGLQTELSDHLGYDKHERAARGSNSGNCRNGSTPKTVRTEVGEVDLDTPRDRHGSFQPRLVPKGARDVGESLPGLGRDLAGRLEQIGQVIDGPGQPATATPRSRVGLTCPQKHPWGVRQTPAVSGKSWTP